MHIYARLRSSNIVRKQPVIPHLLKAYLHFFFKKKFLNAALLTFQYIFHSSIGCIRFYLGLALAQQKAGVGNRGNEAITYLHDGLMYLLQSVTARAEAGSDRSDWSLFQLNKIWYN